MLGFVPDVSMRDNLDHGKRLIEECDHGSVHQLQKFWQDPNMYYAFQSRAGAEWMARHGGPPKFMRMVASALPIKPKKERVPRPCASVNCYSCGKKFESFVKPVDFCIYRCMCTQKIVHKKCFMGKICAWCGTEYTVKVCESKRIIDL